MMADQITANIRTACIAVVGALATWLLRVLGVQIDTTAAVALVTPVVTATVYAAVHWLELHVDRRFGWIFGVPKAPQYPGSGPA